ncbi:SDR family NAD(P)-dependent oxidoreductase [Psychromicrobium sp. YIM B11713]|uniref:SDR family NAD(P)-dependent oxidoreductase n=1 Tax=Psychromicrobium sp. YIM B11713 TaxID=3145233 RepID=UPI00374F6FEA
MKNILITGASSATGIAVAKTFVDAGDRVLIVGSSAERIEAAAAASGAISRVADLSNPEEVAEVHEWIGGPLDGLVHLVGGWRGGGSIPEQQDADWGFLSNAVIQTLRVTSREFFTELAENAGRLTIVSSTAVAAPTASNANYVAAKAAAEAWTLAVAEGFAKHAGDSDSAAAFVFRVNSLLTDDMKTAQPERTFPGYTHVDDLASRILEAFRQPGTGLNGTILDLTTS